MIRRLWKRIRRRRSTAGAAGDMFLKDDVGPHVGDEVWITVGTDKEISHIGPEEEGDVAGGDGQYIEWIEIDDRGHVVDVGTGSFS